FLPMAHSYLRRQARTRSSVKFSDGTFPTAHSSEKCRDTKTRFIPLPFRRTGKFWRPGATIKPLSFGRSPRVRKSERFLDITAASSAWLFVRTEKFWRAPVEIAP